MKPVKDDVFTRPMILNKEESERLADIISPKSAKEMFEELGYAKSNILSYGSSVITYSKKEAVDDTFNLIHYIRICKNYVEYMIVCNIINFPYTRIAWFEPTDLERKAVIKQLNELGCDEKDLVEYSKSAREKLRDLENNKQHKRKINFFSRLFRKGVE